MDVRSYLDPETDEPHIHNHGIAEEEVVEALPSSSEDRPGRDGCRIFIGRTLAGKHLRVVRELDSVLVMAAHELAGEPLVSLSETPPTERNTMGQQISPPGWDEEGVREVLGHHEEHTEDEAAAEDEAAFEDRDQAFMEIPQELVPEVRSLIARHKTRT